MTIVVLLLVILLVLVLLKMLLFYFYYLEVSPTIQCSNITDNSTHMLYSNVKAVVSRQTSTHTRFLGTSTVHFSLVKTNTSTSTTLHVKYGTQLMWWHHFLFHLSHDVMFVQSVRYWFPYAPDIPGPHTITSYSKAKSGQCVTKTVIVFGHM